MSYARLDKDCDVYVYLDVDGYLCCCFCSLHPKSFHAFSTAEMVEHLRAHTAVGDQVPSDTVEDIIADGPKNDEWMNAAS